MKRTSYCDAWGRPGAASAGSDAELNPTSPVRDVEPPSVRSTALSATALHAAANDRLIGCGRNVPSGVEKKHNAEIPSAAGSTGVGGGCGPKFVLILPRQVDERASAIEVARSHVG